MRDGSRQLDVAHALTANLGQRDFHAATVADNAFMLDSLVLSAVTFPIACGSENLFAEQAVFFRLERTIIDGFGLSYFPARPRTDYVRRRNLDRNKIKARRNVLVGRAVRQRIIHLPPQLLLWLNPISFRF